VAIVHVTHVETGALAAQPARPQSRQGAFVGQLVQRVSLLHELRELATTKELAHHRHHRPDVDQRDRRDLLRVADAHALAHHALHAQEPHAKLVLDELAHRLDAAIAKVVDVISVLDAIVHQDHAPYDADDVALGQRAVPNGRIDADAPVQLVPPHPSQVVAAGAEEERFQIAAGIIQRGWIARAHLFVELFQCLHGIRRRVVGQSRLDVLVIGRVVHLGKELQELLVAPLGDRGIVRAVRHRAQRPKQHRHWNLALAIHLHREHVTSRRLELEPRAPIRDKLGHAELAPSGAVLIHGKVGARRANQLANDYALSTVDDESAVLRHDRKIAHVDVLHHGQVRLTVVEQHLDV